MNAIMSSLIRNSLRWFRRRKTKHHYWRATFDQISVSLDYVENKSEFILIITSKWWCFVYSRSSTTPVQTAGGLVMCGTMVSTSKIFTVLSGMIYFQGKQGSMPPWKRKTVDYFEEISMIYKQGTNLQNFRYNMRNEWRWEKGGRSRKGSVCVCVCVTLRFISLLFKILPGWFGTLFLYGRDLTDSENLSFRNNQVIAWDQMKSFSKWYFSRCSMSLSWNRFFLWVL